MRYTTIIDISEYPSLYRNATVRMVYLHMVLKSGYHDNDRDLVDISIRRLSMETGCSVSAVRHALHVLEQSQLIRKQGTLWQVRKFVIEQPITSRAKTKKSADQARIRAQEDAEREAREAARAAEEKKRSAEIAAGRHPYIVYYEEQMRKAADGDPEAAAVVRNNKLMYETLKKQVP